MAKTFEHHLDESVKKYVADRDFDAAIWYMSDNLITNKFPLPSVLAEQAAEEFAREKVKQAFRLSKKFYKKKDSYELLDEKQILEKLGL